MVLWGVKFLYDYRFKALYTTNSVADSHHLDTDPDADSDADSDPACHFDAGQDPDPSFQIKGLKP
jgi:hypothetical protein